MMRSSCPECGSLLTMTRDASGGRQRERRWYCPKAIGAQVRSNGSFYMPEGDPHKAVIKYTQADLVNLEMTGRTK